MIRLIAFRTLFALTSILTALTVARPALAGGCHDRQCAQPAVTHAQLYQAWLILCDNPQLCRKHPELARELRELWGVIVVTRAAGSHSAVLPITAPPEKPGEFPSGTLTLPARFGDYELDQEIGRSAKTRVCSYARPSV